MAQNIAPGIRSNIAKSNSLSGEATERSPQGRYRTAPLSYAQQRLWFLEQLEPGSSTYNLPLAVELEGELNERALARSLNEIVRRHETLRTRFTAVEGRPVQVIAPAQERALSVIELGGLAWDKREEEVKRRIEEEASRGFDLSQGPLMRMELLRLGAAEHVLVVNQHHIISDGWSVGIFFQELKMLYEAFSAGQGSPLAEPSFQYRDFTVWQRQWLSEGVLERQLSYWKQQLGGSVPVLELPVDRPRAALQSSRGATQYQVLPAEVTELLGALSLSEGCTLFMTLLGAFQTLLYRYSGQTDIVVGTPIANRTRAEFEELIGFFVNTLVLRTRLSGEQTFRQLMRTVREVTLEAYAHQDLPFEKLVEELQPERDLSHTPLFQVMFVLQNIPEQELELAGVKVTPLEVEGQTAMFDLTLSMEETSEGLSAVWEYNTDLFDDETIERMKEHFQVLLEGIVADPEQRLARLPLMTAGERRQQLVEWNDTVSSYPQTQCIHQLFEAQAERSPETTAVRFGAVELSYGELNQRANQLAHHLRGLGVGPEVLVGVCVERSLEMVVGILGVLKAGGAYVPLDPSYPRERIAFMLDDARVPVLLTQAQLLQQLPPSNARIICLDTDWPRIAVQDTRNPFHHTTLDNLVYVIYTSGSTGCPKGTMISHRSVVNYTHWFSTESKMGPGDRLLQFASLGFDTSVEEIFSTLTSGSILVLRNDEMLSSPEKFFQTSEELGVTILDLPTSFWHELARQTQDRPFGLPECVRAIAIGGETASVDSMRRWLDQVGLNVRIINAYGPTETTIVATFCEFTAVADTRATVPIGKPVSNVQIYILDSQQQPVPVGVMGELHIGGVGLARGYLNRADLTAEKFIPDGFSGAGGRLYKTGDLARYLGDGNIEFLGRIDHQVKVRGYRIELGEIETVLAQSPDVRECAVLAREDVPGDKRLVAYVVAASGELDVGELRSFLREKLPEYMVPGNFVALESMPLTPNGKVNRQALPAPSRWREEKTGAEHAPPRNRVEEVLLGIWSQILGVDNLQIHANFFEAGGHSLLATQLVSRLRDAFQVEVPLRTIFEAPTIAELAQQIEGMQHADGVNDF